MSDNAGEAGKRVKNYIAGLPRGVKCSKVKNGLGRTIFLLRLGKKWTGGKAVRKQFDTIQAVREFWEKEEQQRDKTGKATYLLTPGQIGEALEAIKRLAGRMSLLEAVDYAVANGLPKAGTIGVEEAIQKFLGKTRKRPLSDKTKKSYRCTVRNLFEEFPKAIHEIQKEDVEDFLNDEDHEPATQSHYLRNLRAFFSWAKEDGYGTLNPCESIPEPASDKEVTFLTPAETMHVLKTALPEMRLPFAFLLFGGVRTNEIKQLTWGDVLDEEFKVAAKVAKTRKRRANKINPTLQAWINTVPKNNRHGFIAPQPWRKFFKESIQAAGYFYKPAKKTDENGKPLPQEGKRWPTNAMRHSFGTYYYKKSNDENTTAALMGNSPEVVHKHYKGLVTGEEANRYWKIVPKKQVKHSV